MTQIPLFPLGSVLVPGQVLPMHIFEPQYVQLLEELQEEPEAERVFGIVAIREGIDDATSLRGLHDMGCTALVRRIIQRDDDRFDIVVTGQHRFELDALCDDVQTPYLQARVTPVQDVAGASDDDIADLAESVGDALNIYRAERGEETVELPRDPRFVSYLVTVGLPLPLHERVGLMRLGTTKDRLLMALNLLRRERVVYAVTQTTPDEPVDIHLDPN